MKKEPIILLDLFSGAMGFSLALKRLGIPIKEHYYSEIDKHAIAVSQLKFKKAKYVGNITTIQGLQFKTKPNVITFGFPCQDLSIAGRGAGIKAGTRSGLFYEATRLIRELRPKIFIFENVKGLLSNKGGADFAAVLREIADCGLYDCEWQLLNTKWILPQNRERIYFVGHLRGECIPGVFPITEADEIHNQRKQKASNQNAQALGANDFNSCVNNFIDVTNFPGKKINNSLRTRGNNTQTNKHNFDTVRITAYSTPSRKHKNQNGPREKQEGESIFTLTSQDVHGIKITTNNKAGIVPALTNGLGGRLNIAEPQEQVRRLTEVEFERLQGFPDNWTKEGLYGTQIKPIAKGNRYKLMGNAVSVDIVMLVVSRIPWLQDYLKR